MTDSTPLEEPKNPDTCNVFSIYQLLASESQTATLREKYLAGGYGYGHAKKDLLGLILDKYNTQRASFDEYMADYLASAQ